MVQSSRLGGLVGSGLFFAAVSSRMAHALPIGHAYGKRSDSHTISSRIGSYNTLHSDFVAAERATGWLGYAGTNLLVTSGQRILLDVLPARAAVFGGEVLRSLAAESAFYLDATTGADAVFTSYAALADACETVGALKFLATVARPADDVLTNVKIPINAAAGGDGWAAFPAFDLYASLIGGSKVGTSVNSYPTIKLADAADMTVGAELTQLSGLGGFMLEQTGSDASWLVWAKPAADVPLKSFMRLRMDVLVAGK